MNAGSGLGVGGLGGVGGVGHGVGHGAGAGGVGGVGHGVGRGDRPRASGLFPMVLTSGGLPCSCFVMLSP